MNTTISEKFGLGPIGQVAYVVHDMAQALESYGAVFGPFESYKAELKDCTIRGEKADCTLHVATNNLGPIEVELIAVLEGHPPHKDHLLEHGEGLHHIRFDVEDIEKKLAAMVESGFEVIFYQEFSPEISFAYLESPAEMGGHIVELLQMPSPGEGS